MSFHKRLQRARVILIIGLVDFYAHRNRTHVFVD